MFVLAAVQLCAQNLCHSCPQEISSSTTNGWAKTRCLLPGSSSLLHGIQQVPSRGDLNASVQQSGVPHSGFQRKCCCSAFLLPLHQYTVEKWLEMRPQDQACLDSGVWPRDCQDFEVCRCECQAFGFWRCVSLCRWLWFEYQCVWVHSSCCDHGVSLSG